MPSSDDACAHDVAAADHVLPLLSRRAGPQAAGSETVEFVRDGLAWRCRADYAGLIAACPLNWLKPRPGPDAEVVKSNAHRSVWRVRVGGTGLYAKVYRPTGWIARLKQRVRGPTAGQEWEVGQYAAAHAVPTVCLVACAWPAGQPRSGPSVLVTLAVAQALSLAEYWQRLGNDRAAVRMIVEVTARLVARAHQTGFHHRDMHVGNILVRRGAGAAPEPLFVDLHNVRTGRCVSSGAVVANLAQLNQWFRRNASSAQRLLFLKKYLEYRDVFGTVSPFARNWQFELRTLLAELDRRAARHAEQLWAKRDRRALREGRYFCRIRPAAGWQGLGLNQARHLRPGSALHDVELDRRFWQERLRQPLDLLNDPAGRVLKDSHSSFVFHTRLATPAGELGVVVKRWRPRSWVKRLKQCLGHSRNRRTWRMAHRLVHRDLPTAVPLALLERRIGALGCLDSLLITEAVASLGDLEFFLAYHVPTLAGTAQRRAKRAVIEALVRLFRDFHDRGFVHRDLKASNLLVAPASLSRAVAAPQLVLIDLDGVSHRAGRPAPETDRHRALARLNVSLLHVRGVTRTDRLRFLRRLMLEPGRSDRGWKALWRKLEAWSLGKAVQKERRRLWKLRHYGRE